MYILKTGGLGGRSRPLDSIIFITPPHQQLDTYYVKQWGIAESLSV